MSQDSPEKKSPSELAADAYVNSLAPEKRYQLTEKAEVVKKFFENQANKPVKTKISSPDTVSVRDRQNTFRNTDISPSLPKNQDPAQELSLEDAVSAFGDVTQETTEDNLGTCPECGSHLVLYHTRRGQMAGCARFPACRFMRPMAGVYKVRIEMIIEGSSCPLCGSPVAVKSGRYGQFIGCTNYPNCSYIFREKREKLPCPMCNTGNLVLHKTRFQKVYWSCDAAPYCHFKVSKKPVLHQCEKCGSKVMLESRGKKGAYYKCPVCGAREMLN